MEGQLLANDEDGDPSDEPLTYSVVSGPPQGAGTFDFDSSTGEYTFTPNPNFEDTAYITFKVNDGALDSNIAALAFPGYTIITSVTNDVTGTGGGGSGDNPPTWTLVDDVLPTAADMDASVSENGQLTLDAAGGLLSEASSNDPEAHLTVVPTLFAEPEHGRLTAFNADDGSFTYVPDAGFSGVDSFTFRVTDGMNESSDATVFLYVAPLTADITIGDFAPEDPNASLPYDPSPTAAGTPMEIDYDGVLADQSTITLSVNSASASKIEVWTGNPNDDASVEILGGTAGASKTWTVGTDGPIPREVYVVGRASTDSQAVQFTLTVTPAEQGSGASGGMGAGISVTQLATVLGENGYLVAIDGTSNIAADNTKIHTFRDAYDGVRNYYPGVGNVDQNPGVLRYAKQGLGIGTFGMIHTIEADLSDFYQTVANRALPVDLIGYSRGAFQAVAVADWIARGGIVDLSGAKTIPDPSSSRPRTKTVYERPPIIPKIRFVGLISPVGQAPPWLNIGLPTAVPKVASAYEARDNNPGNIFTPQTDIDFTNATVAVKKDYDHEHAAIGFQDAVGNDMKGAAGAAGVRFL